jgi:hypothetical protein
MTYQLVTGRTATLINNTFSVRGIAGLEKHELSRELINNSLLLNYARIKFRNLLGSLLHNQIFEVGLEW